MMEVFECRKCRAGPSGVVVKSLAGNRRCSRISPHLRSFGTIRSCIRNETLRKHIFPSCNSGDWGSNQKVQTFSQTLSNDIKSKPSKPRYRAEGRWSSHAQCDRQCPPRSPSPSDSSHRRAVCRHADMPPQPWHPPANFVRVPATRALAQTRDPCWWTAG